MSAPRVLYHHRIRADDGQAVHVREMIAALRASGCAVDECALVRKGRGDADASAAGAGGGFWHKLSLPRTAVEALEILYNRRGRVMLRAAAAQQRPDFVYERHALHCRAGLDAARALGVPLLLEVNSPMTVEMAKLGKLRFPARARATERLVLAGADAVLAVTQTLADMLVELGARRERVRVIGNGADPARYGGDAVAAAASARARWGLPADAFALGFVGYMRDWHRLDLVLDAMAKPELATLALVLMGEGPALAPLLASASARGLAERVRALGVVPPELLPMHVLACDGALIPAINAYASPLKLFDSLAAGVPTVAPDQPNLRETLVHGDTGLLFRPGDADDLARQLARLVGDRAGARALGARGRAALHAQQWTWQGNAGRVLEVFAGLRRGGLA
ncbi:MAG: glycosyltransferase family 4 protein [Planctomycetes bacterium]|nr:glycosyltransferase family 4 protein [Planctomycetota bacterium]